MKKKIVTIFTCAMIICGAFTMDTYVWAEAAEPEVTAKSAIIYCADTKEIIWQKNSDQQMEPASMTKLLTCLIAAENLELDDVVEVPKEATNVIPTKMYLQPGEKITVEELMYAALLTSANDAANALAIETAGSIEKFAEMMNERAAELGCTSTNFVNPSGLSANGQLSTAYDMALIAEETLNNETVRKISSTTDYTIPATNLYESRELKSFNMFLYGASREIDGMTFTVKKYDGVFGGKTGSLSKEYCTMVTGLDCNGVEIYTVIMDVNMASRFDDMKVLMDYSKANVSKYVAFEKGHDFGKVKLKGGTTNKVTAIAANGGYVNLPVGASESLVTTKCKYTDNLMAPIEKGQRIGVVEIYIADELYNTVDLVAESNVKEGWYFSKWGITNVQTVVIGLLLICAVVFTGAVLSLRKRNKKRRIEIRNRKLAEEAKRQLEREEDLKKRNWHF